MNKTINTVILCFFLQSVIAQKGIDSLIKAEKNFAAYSVAYSTKEAFEQFIDSNSIMFDEGKPVKATEFWGKRQKRTGILNWHPQFAEISASEDFGYTTGPWTYQVTQKDSVIARGQYSTVWKLDRNGKWKFLVDFGIDNTQPGSNEERILDTPKESEDKGDHSPASMLERAELNFNTLEVTDKSKAYSTYLSKESILTRNGFLPANNSVTRKVIIDSTPAGISYTTNGWGISSAQDIGYTYGSATINGKPQNYMRIWRREMSGWKIALEVLRY